MREALAIGVAALALTGAGAASAATQVEIKDAVARVTVIPENRSDVRVEFITTNGALPLQTRNQGDRLVIDGNLRRRIRNCSGGSWNLDINGRRSQGQRANVEVRGVGRVGWNDIPQIVVRTPMNTRVGASGAVFGSVGRTASLDLDNAGCGDWTIANVAGPLRIDIAGSGDARAGSAGQLRARIAGSGDIEARAVNGGANIDIAGSGDVDIASVSGPLDVDIAGSGDVSVGSGSAPSVRVHIAGSGDVSFGGAARSLEASIAGSGDVNVASVNGPIKRSVLGSGSVIVAGREIRNRRSED